MEKVTIEDLGTLVEQVKQSEEKLRRLLKHDTKAEVTKGIEDVSRIRAR